jgi:hypothetical protein
MIKKILKFLSEYWPGLALGSLYTLFFVGVSIAFYCSVITFQDSRKAHKNTQKLEPFIVLGQDLRGYEIEKDQSKYWIFTNGFGEPVVVDVTYKPEF